MKTALVKTDFHFPGQKSVYHGKVRDVYSVGDDYWLWLLPTVFRHST